MNKAKLAAATLAVALGLAGVAALPTATEAHGRWGSSMMWHGSKHVEGRIAFLQAELQITDAQMPQWNRLAEVIRANAARTAELRDRARAMRDEDEKADPVQRLELSQQFAAARAEALNDFVAAFKPLYNVLSDEQKEAAADLFSRRHRRG